MNRGHFLGRASPQTFPGEAAGWEAKLRLHPKVETSRSRDRGCKLTSNYSRRGRRQGRTWSWACHCRAGGTPGRGGARGGRRQAASVPGSTQWECLGTGSWPGQVSLHHCAGHRGLGRPQFLTEDTKGRWADSQACLGGHQRSGSHQERGGTPIQAEVQSSVLGVRARPGW